MIFPDEIIRSNRKRLAICIDGFGRVIARAPMRMEEKHILAFINEKESWIRKKKAQTAGVSMALPPENLDGYSFLLLGKDCKIRVYEGKKVGFDNENGVLYLPKDKPRERLVKWLKENAKRIFLSVTEQKAQEMGVQFQSVGVSSAKTRWGVCSADNRIRYTFRLLYAPKEIIEYVVVHELAHVKYKNHSASFWREVTKYIPDWKIRRKWLKTHGALMEIF